LGSTSPLVVESKKNPLYNGFVFNGSVKFTSLL
jgi:hypothetical protein